MRHRIRFGIAGCGVIGAVHAEAVTSLPEATLVAVADSPESGDRAVALARAHGARAYASLEEMLAQAQVDVVNICTPSGLHAEQAIEAMRAGRHVMVEKPMALTREGIDAMLAAQREAGVKLAVMSQHRFDPAAAELYRLTQAGSWGRVALGVAHVPWWRAQTYYDSADWRGTRDFDGGVLMNQAIHTIDLLLWLLGPARSVMAQTGTRAHRMETEDTAAAALTFESGALGTIAATTAAYPGLKTRLEIWGDSGSAVLVDDRLEFVDTIHGRPDMVDLPERVRFGDSHRKQIADMIAAIHSDCLPAVAGVEGRRPVDLILAILESAETGTTVRL